MEYIFKKILNITKYFHIQLTSLVLLLTIFLSGKSSDANVINHDELNNILNANLDGIEMIATKSYEKKEDLVLTVTEDVKIEDKIETLTTEKVEKETLSPEEMIMDKYNLSEEEFKTIVGVVLAEAKVNSYEDAYAVINTIYNRTISKVFINQVKTVMGRDDGDNLYVQVICPGQFSTYIEGTYKNLWDRTDLIGYQAILDFLLSEEPMHNYLGFWGDITRKEGSIQFVSHGNRYFYELTEEDRVEEKEFCLKREKMIRNVIN